jgi:cellulose synthase/poly-beta-1,6-N-acetylglucosamine synthase-like glycosyltransferase
MTALSWITAGLYLTLLSVMSMLGIHRLRLLQLSGRASPLVSLLSPRETPSVTVQLPVYNEPWVIERLMDAVCRLDWPLACLEIQVLDDSDDRITTERAQARAATWRQRGVRIAVIRRSDRSGYKAGALAHGLATAQGRYIAIFDADFLPPVDFLRRTIPSFFETGDTPIGMVQARWGHLNRHHGLLTRLQALLLDGHFILEHTARYRAGRFFNFNGTAGIWDRRCIDAAGGWTHDTITEDVDLSYRAQLAGWRFVYLPDVVVPAELPSTMSAFMTQQHRWTQGTIQTARKLLLRILRAPVPMRTRFEAAIHLLGPLGCPLLFSLAVLLPPSIAARMTIGRADAIALDLFTFILTTGSVVLFYGTALRRAGGPWVRALWQLPALMALGVGMAPTLTVAVVQGAFGRDVQFVRTPKSGGHASATAAGAPSRTQQRARWVTAGMAVYLTASVVWAIAAGHWASLPFLLLFASGMTAVAVLSFAPGHTHRAMRAAEAAETAVAPAAK